MACSLRSPSRQFSRLLLASLRQRKGLGFQLHKDSADTADGAVELGRVGHLEISEHARGPRLEMPLEETRLLAEFGFEVAAREAGHDLEQNRDVIFGLAGDACALDAECVQIFADARQRALVKKAGQIIGGIWKQLAAAEPDEQIEEFLADGAVIGRGRSRSEFDMRHAEIGRISL